MKMLQQLMVAFLMLPVWASAEENAGAAKVPAKPVNPVGAEELASVTLGLLMILALIFALAWLYRRYGNFVSLNRSDIQILGGVSLGSREKAVLLEVEGTRLLVGVAAGQVNTLHVFDSNKAGNFSKTLQQASEDMTASVKDDAEVSA